MAKRSKDDRRLKLNKETIRALAHRVLRADELLHVAGGMCIKPSVDCSTMH
jgi:hypothetical protein